MSNNSADKRSVSTDALETLGTIIDSNQKRDAIHLAVEPVVANEFLRPGEHITVKNGVAFRTEKGEGLGIVDPFLPRSVKAGERFWFVMYPRMVKSLRHVWSHPDFEDEGSIVASTEVRNMMVSETWLRNFCRMADCPDYETLMEAIKNGGSGSGYDRITIDEDYIFSGGSDAHGSIPPEFWYHVETLLGPQRYKPDSFSCSC